jgi:PAS domain-containing protein
LPAIDELTGIDHEVLTTFFTHASDAALVINKMRRILTMNSAAVEVTGWKQRDLTSINCSVMACRDEQGKKLCGESCMAQRCIDQAQPIGPIYLRISKADGTPVATEATYLPYGIGPRGASACLLLLKDVSMLEHLDATVRQLGQEVAQRNMLLRSVSDQMSVSWRASMIDIRSGGESLRSRYGRELGDSGARTIDRLITASQKLESTFALLKSQIAATLQNARPPHQG